MKTINFFKTALLTIALFVCGNVGAEIAYNANFANQTGASGSYSPNVTISLENQEWYASYCYFGSNEFRLGHNKTTGVVPSKFLTDQPQGASIEMLWDIANVTKISVLSEKSYGTTSDWYIFESTDGGSNWTASGYNLDCERVITRIIGDTLHFDNPVLMSMEDKYGGGAVFKSSFTGRISHCGVEDMQIVSEFDENKKDPSGYYNDENHSWTAIDITKTEHSWIRGVTSRYFAYGLAEIRNKSLFITVENCQCLDGVAKREGGRLYSFLIADASACLVRNCETSHGRHDCVTGSKGIGPNVFTHVKIRNTHGDTGPHQRWNVGTLYDNIDSDGDILVQDRGDWGTGHGWAGANQYLWNCTAKRICVQSPWVSAKNYSIGSKGTKISGTHNNSDRPDGVWIEQGKTVSPASLFEAQLNLRISEGRLYHVGGH